MAPAKTCDALEPISNRDLISNLPDIAIDKILKLLPIKTVASMSILSRTWRNIWLSFNYLIFDEGFWNELGYVKSKHASVASNCNRIISNILFHHLGPVYEFNLYVPDRVYPEDCFSCGKLATLLSKFRVKKITILLTDNDLVLPSQIFDCQDLVKFVIEGFILRSPPSNFERFPYLRYLEIFRVYFEHDMLNNLIASCPRLAVFKLEYCDRVRHLIIDMPSLECLTIDSDFDTIVFKNAPRLSFVSLVLDKARNHIVKVGNHVIEMLATSCQLQDLHFGGTMCKVIDAGCISTSAKFKFLHRLHLIEVDLSVFNSFCFTLAMVQSCSFIKDLEIEVPDYSRKYDVEHEVEYNKKCELKYLVKVKITGLTGSIPELKLIEYILSIASTLEKLAYNFYILDPISELMATRGLAELPRASTKAKLVCLR